SIWTALQSARTVPTIVATHLGNIISKNGKSIKADESFLTTSSVLFDAVYIAGGKESVDTLLKVPEALEFLNQAYKHFKPIGINGEGIELFQISDACIKLHNKSDDAKLEEEGILINKNSAEFIEAIAKHRYWNRQIC
ncbi:MAG: catalase HPII, partial [bacterium]